MQKVNFWWSCKSTKGVKRLFRKKSSQQCLELFGPVRQSKWKDRLLLQEGNGLRQLPLCLSVCLFTFLTLCPHLSCFLLECLLNLFGRHAYEILKLLLYKNQKFKHTHVTLSAILHTLSCCVLSHWEKKISADVCLPTCWQRVCFWNTRCFN